MSGVQVRYHLFDCLILPRHIWFIHLLIRTLFALDQFYRKRSVFGNNNSTSIHWPSSEKPIIRHIDNAPFLSRSFGVMPGVEKDLVVFLVEDIYGYGDLLVGL